MSTGNLYRLALAVVLTEAMSTLSPRWRAVPLTEVEGVTPSELAPGVGTTANAVAAVAYRAHKRLRDAHREDTPAGVRCA